MKNELNYNSHGPSEIRVKFGLKDKKIYKLTEFKKEKFCYDSLIKLSSTLSPNPELHCLFYFIKSGSETKVINSESEFQVFLSSGMIFNYIDKNSLKIDFEYRDKPKEEIVKPEVPIIPSLNHSKVQEFVTDKHSSIFLEVLISAITENPSLKKNIIDKLRGEFQTDLNQEEISDLIKKLSDTTRDNYSKYLNIKGSFANLHMNLQLKRSTSNEDLNGDDSATFSKLYNEEEIEEFSSKIIRESVSYIQPNKK